MRFTIRDLLWLTVGVAWWMDHHLAAVRAAERERLWGESVWSTVEELSQRTNLPVQVLTPDGVLIGPIPGTTHERQAIMSNLPSD